MKSRLPPPAYLNLLLVLAILLHVVVPIKRIIYPPYTYGGIMLILLGLILNVWSGSMLRTRNTTIDFHEAPSRLVTDGPFRISRNPVYLSGVILSLGVAVLLGSLVAFAFPVALLVILDRLYVPVEEKRLEEGFGREYLEYKRSVRRWI